MPADSPETPDRPDDMGLRAALDANGLALSAEELDSVRRVSASLKAGVTRLAAMDRPRPGPTEAPPTDTGAADLTIAEAGRRLRDGRLTSLELTQAHLARIAAREPELHAFFQVTADRALTAAKRADDDLRSGVDLGPMHGIPIGIKDMIDVEGVPTTAGSAARRNAVADKDAAVVGRLVECGAIVIGKLATYEWATVGPSTDTLFPPTRNPCNPQHITGGSSSGAAAAVAAGLIRTAVGTDTGGSVRSPASYCGVVGLKPTFGLLPIEGTLPLAPGLDHLGALSATVAEAAITVDVMAGRREGGSGAASRLGMGVGGLRVGYARRWFAEDPALDPAILAAIDAAVSQLSLLGATIEEIDLPDYDLFEGAGAAILHAEAFELHRANLSAHPEAYGRKAYQTLVAGAVLSKSDHAEALRASTVLRDRLDTEVFGRFDAIVTATTLTTAPTFAEIGKSAAWTPMRTIAFNVTGHPALSLLVGHAGGLPIGMQIIGRHHDESTLCQLGHAYEQSAAPVHAPRATEG